jgi:hypothetical protein
LALAFLLIVFLFVIALIVLFAFPPSFMVKLMSGKKPGEK